MMERTAAAVVFRDEAANEWLARLDVGGVTYEGRGTSASVALMLVGRALDACDRAQRRVRIGAGDVP